MYQFVFILLFSSISIANCVPEHARIVTVNITQDEDYEIVECASQNIQLTDGEQIQLVANIPYDAETYMQCHNDNHTFLMTRCNRTGTQCTHLFQFSTSMQGRWQCIYLMDTNETINPAEYYNGKLYTKAICKLNFEVEKSTSVTTDVKEVGNEKKLECVVTQNMEDRVMFQEQFLIIANTPYKIEYMWCDVDKENALVDGCTNSGKQCTKLFGFRGAQLLLSQFKCTYLMDTNGMVERNAYVDGIKKYSKATCKFDVRSMGFIEYRSVTVDIKLNDDKTRVECVSRNEQERLIDGELVHLEANVPYHVKAMWCQNDKGNLIANRCVHNGDQLCYSAFHFSKSLQGRWECFYELRTNGSVEPVALNRFGRKVTKATCVLNLEAIDHRNVTVDIKVVDNATSSTNSES